jgi:signal transduction histidine kinase
LISQMILILLAGMVVSHLAAGWIYTSDRTRVARAIGGYAAAQRIANLAHLIDEAPPEWRVRLIAVAADPRLRISLSSRPPPTIPETTDAADLPIRAYLLDQLSEVLGANLQVLVTRPAGQARPDMPPPWHHDEAWSEPLPPIPMADGAGGSVSDAAARGSQAGSEKSGAQEKSAMTPRRPASADANGMGPWMHGPGMLGPGPGGPGPPHWRRIRVTMQLTDGQWLSFNLGVPDTAPTTSWQFLIAMGVMSGIVVLASVWAVRRATAPLGVVTQAAERLGRDVNAPPIAETGSAEMRQAAQAFNDMQARLQRLLQNRTTMLAALSHDLRTPLTLLRLRIESLPEAEERDRMLASVETLDGMVDATLKFARDASTPETWRRTDLTSLLDSIVDDMADAGMPVTMEPAASVVLECQPGGLRRAVTNLLDNAIKYGQRARLMLETSADRVRIVIDDDGPGIPDGELLNVFEPYFRLEQSRNRDTGGTGLGLAIAQTIAEAHDGRIELANRSGGGLRAVLDLPRVGVHVSHASRTPETVVENSPAPLTLRHSHISE